MIFKLTLLLLVLLFFCSAGSRLMIASFLPWFTILSLPLFGLVLVMVVLLSMILMFVFSLLLLLSYLSLLLSSLPFAFLSSLFPFPFHFVLPFSFPSSFFSSSCLQFSFRSTLKRSKRKSWDRGFLFSPPSLPLLPRCLLFLLFLLLSSFSPSLPLLYAKGKKGIDWVGGEK